jgi:large subunit ribosomal protein L3
MSQEEVKDEVLKDNASSEENITQEATQNDSIELQGSYFTKVGMSSVYDEDGKSVPVTVLKYSPAYISQIKTKEKDGYEAVQLAFVPKKAKNSLKSEVGHLKKTNFENAARFVKEIRQSVEGLSVAQKILLSSFKKGDLVKVTGKTKGRGFAGAMKRHGFGGGPASHGSGFHRRPGSIGNCNFPGRVMKNRKMPGHYGVETVSLPRVKIVDVLEEENVILIKGPVPGSRNSLVKLMKV